MSVTINGSTGVTTPGISNSEGYTGDGLTIAAGAPSGAVAVDSSGNVGIGTSSPTTRLTVSGGNTTAATIDYNGGIATGAEYSALRFTASAAGFVPAEIRAVNTNGAQNLGVMQMFTAGSERARIDSSGNLLVGATSSVSSSVPGVQIYKNGPNGGSIKIANNQTGGFQYVMAFINGNGDVGRIDTSGSSTSYVTSSDYRLKNTITPMTGALAKVALLKPCTYKWNVDGSDGEGFIAHELAEVCPQAVSGEKDAVDADGNPQYQGIDTSFLVATLTAAIQEQQALIESLTARVVALEGAQIV